MKLPKVKIRHKETGVTMNVNEIDYAQGNIPGISLSAAEWERVSETHGDKDVAEAEKIAHEQRATALRLQAEKDEKEKKAAEAAKNAIDTALASKPPAKK